MIWNCDEVAHKYGLSIGATWPRYRIMAIRFVLHIRCFETVTDTAGSMIGNSMGIEVVQNLLRRREALTHG